MRIVLLGSRNEGKSSSGNTIMGREVFNTSVRTAECVKREGEMAGKVITIVEAPGWWNNKSVEHTPESDKQEIALSVSLCPPGPHALLLAIDTSHSFTETHRRAVTEHLELLGETVWSHTIVLFTRGDWLGDKSIEQHIESGGEALQWVVEKCGNRYHVVDNKKSDSGQVTELLEKMEEMVAGNRGHHFDFDRNISEHIQEKKKKEMIRAMERKMKVQKQRETLRSAGGVQYISDLRIVLLGGRKTGKSSLGNTILGREEFGISTRTAESVKREGEIAGRHITIVEAPGWWKVHILDNTLERDRREIVLSVSLCPPGPHALLLIINVSKSFTETYRRAVQDHLELLGQKVWCHTIVLFTRGDWLGDTNIEQQIESGGEALQWVVEKCGNRYHVVDNMKSDGGQVTELLEKIEETVAGNRGHLFDFDRNISKQIQERKKEEERRAEQRRRKVQKQRETLRSLSDEALSISSLRIVLLGGRESGKSSSGNTILGRKEFGITGRTAECMKREGETTGRHITVVEAPGWWKNYTTEQTPERDKREIVLSVSLCPPGPHILLLVININKSFTETNRQAVQEHVELLGERVWSHTIVLFTYGDWLGDTSIEQHIESEGEALQWVVEKCGNRYHVVDNMKSDGGQVTELLEKIEETVAGNRGQSLFDFDRYMFKQIQERKKEEERRAEQRRMTHTQAQEGPFGNTTTINECIGLRSSGIVMKGSHQGPNECVSELTASLLTKDHFRCSVCTEVLRDPVSIPCGHSYCRQCIIFYWAQPNHAGLNACPQCSHTYSSCPALYTNSALAEVIQKLQHLSPVPPAQCYAGAGDGACDFCTGRKLRAVKYCITCMASYCESHVRQHYTVPVLQRHALVEPQGQEEKLSRLESAGLKWPETEKHIMLSSGQSLCADPGTHQGTSDKRRKLKREPSPDHPTLEKRIKLERSDSPVPSCMSLKSMDPPQLFKGEYSPDSKIKLERSDSPVPSCLSLKSMDPPQLFKGEYSPDSKIKLERSDSPAPSCLSLKSMDPPQLFKGEDSPDSRIKLERSDSPAPSCMSLKSMDPPQLFQGESSPDSRIKLERSDSPASSCMSLKSMDPPQLFKGEISPDSRIKLERSDSPAPSCMSLKSMDPPQLFKGEYSPDSKFKLEWTDSPAPSGMSLKSMDPPQLFQGEISPDSSEFPANLFILDHFRCSVCVEVLRDPVSIPCGHSYCRQCITSYWAQPNHAGLYACPQCSYTHSSFPALYTNAALAEVIQKLQHLSPVPPAQCYAGAGDVACDFCTGRKLRAVKSCLTCSASYCETHIKEHYTVIVLQRHTLVDSTRDLKKH